MLNPIPDVARDDGIVVIDIPSTLELIPVDIEGEVDCDGIPYSPPIQILLLIAGTKGEVEQFIPIGSRLQDFGHRVRLATHVNFKELVLTAGLEFFPLAGDTRNLVECKLNKHSLANVPIQRKNIKEFIFSVLPACRDPDPDTGVPFKTEAIIANPGAYGHADLAEALKIHLHIFSTIPWTRTSEFPHPLWADGQTTNYLDSYRIVSSMISIGTRGMLNHFRRTKLKLPATSRDHMDRLKKYPHAYIWSPHLVPKPLDWGPNIDVVGSIKHSHCDYMPSESLLKWLEAGDKPIYINLVHHGGGGITASGLKASCPTTIVHILGASSFWGDRVHARSLGPAPIPIHEFSLQKLVDAIKFMMRPQVKAKAVELAKAMMSEDGATGAVRAFVKHLARVRENTQQPLPSTGLLKSQSLASGPFSSWYRRIYSRIALGRANAPANVTSHT